MSSSIEQRRVETPAHQEGLLTRIARNTVHGLLESLEEGVLELRDSGDRHLFGQPESGLEAVVEIHQPDVYTDILLRRHLGAAEAYMDGRWSTPDLTPVLRLFTRNREIFEGKWSLFSSLLTLVDHLYHWRRRNTREGSRRNIQEHYDLGEDFYTQFLDETMNYSCGWFESETDSLACAQTNKMDRLLDKLELEPEHRLLEIGSGWGSLALRAAQRHGCSVTTTTISDNQYRYVKDSVRMQDVSDRVKVLNKDYRDLSGTFDRLVSVEMIEAVGEDYLPRFLEVCQNRLKSGGRLVLQTIVMRDQFYQEYRKNVDFIQRYIFPGGHLPSVGRLVELAGQTTDLRLRHLEEQGSHYATTLQRWKSRFLSKLSEIRSLGFSEQFIRMWEYYFGYCEAGFREDAIGNAQMVFERPS